jgi:H+-transporting ATPase
VEKDGKRYTAAKGAPNAYESGYFAVVDTYKVDRILRLTNPPSDIQETIKQKTQEFARRGFRTLGKLVSDAPKRPLMGPLGAPTKV